MQKELEKQRDELKKIDQIAKETAADKMAADEQTANI